MRFDRPPPGEELNPGAETAPRVAASVIVLRDAAAGLEVLLVQRNTAASFMGGAWVFPGGGVKGSDDDPAAAAMRELEEEAGLVLDGPEQLISFSRWITPAEVKVRFDTWFFLAPAPPDAAPACDGEECVDLRWFAPATALEAGRRGELMLVFPTIKHLEQLAELESVGHAIETARERVVSVITPRVVQRDDGPHVLLPGEPGYED